MLKKWFLTLFIVLILVACFTLPSFADSLNLLPQSMQSWYTLEYSNFEIDTIQFTPQTLTNRVTIPAINNGIGQIGSLYRPPSRSNINGQYNFSFEFAGNFSYATTKVYVVFNEDILSLNDYHLLLSINTDISTNNYTKFSCSFVPSNYGVEYLSKFYIIFTFEKNYNSAVNLYFRNISLTEGSSFDTGSWTGPQLEIDDIDLSTYITGMSDSGDILINFITNGFSYARKGLIGVSGLFSLVWNYLSEHSPVVPYVIVFGLVLGVVSAILSAFTYSKESGTNSYSRDSYDLYNKRFMNRALKHMKKSGNSHYSEL